MSFEPYTDGILSRQNLLEQMPEGSRTRGSHEAWFVTILFCLGLLCLFVASPRAFAEDIHPGQVRVSTPVYKANMDDFSPAEGQYRYRVSWEGIGAARVFMDVERRGERFHLTARAETNSFVDIFYKLRYKAKGEISSEDLSPFTTLIDYRENSRQKKTDIRFLPGGKIHSTHWKKGSGTEEYSFNPENFMLDPFSAAFLARSLPWEKGQVREFDTFNGKSRYLIRFEAVDETVLKVNGEPRKVWVVSPSVKKLTSTEDSQKLKSAKIYVTADKAREVLKIVSSVFVGSVYTELEEFTPFESVLGDQRVAHLSTPQKIRIR